MEYKVAFRLTIIFGIIGGVLGIATIEILRAFCVPLSAGVTFLIGGGYVSLLILLFGDRVINWLLLNVKKNKSKEIVKRDNESMKTYEHEDY